MGTHQGGSRTGGWSNIPPGLSSSGLALQDSSSPRHPPSMGGGSIYASRPPPRFVSPSNVGTHQSELHTRSWGPTTSSNDDLTPQGISWGPTISSNYDLASPGPWYSSDYQLSRPSRANIEYSPDYQLSRPSRANIAYSPGYQSSPPSRANIQPGFEDGTATQLPFSELGVDGPVSSTVHNETRLRDYPSRRFSNETQLQDSISRPSALHTGHSAYNSQRSRTLGARVPTIPSGLMRDQHAQGVPDAVPQTDSQRGCPEVIPGESVADGWALYESPFSSLAPIVGGRISGGGGISDEELTPHPQQPGHQIFQASLGLEPPETNEPPIRMPLGVALERCPNLDTKYKPLIPSMPPGTALERDSGPDTKHNEPLMHSALPGIAPEGHLEPDTRHSTQRSSEELGSLSREWGHQHLDRLPTVRRAFIEKALTVYRAPHSSNCALFQVFWELESFVQEELSPEQRISQVITLTGSEKDAQATTCKDYICTNWPRTGPVLLDAIESALTLECSELVTITRAAEELEVTVSLHGKKGINTPEEGHPPAVIKARGLLQNRADIAAALAWLSATLRISKNKGLAYSNPILSHHVGDSDNTLTFDLRLCELSPVDSKDNMCWHPLFNHGVIVNGFPIRDRKQGMGLDVSVEVMETLAGVIFPVEYNGGLVLKGLSTILVPTKRLGADGAVQWHLIVPSDHSPTSGKLIEKTCPGWLKVKDANELRGQKSPQRAFLGWCRSAKIVLGTKNASYDKVDWSATSRKPKKFHLSGFSLGLSVTGLGIIGGNASANFAVRKSQHYFLDIERDLRERHKPMMLYDRSERRAWLVPTLSVLLHMAHKLVHHHGDQVFTKDGVQTELPYAEAIGDGGQAAYEAILSSMDLIIGVQSPPNPYRFRDLLLRLHVGIDRALEKTIDLMSEHEHGSTNVCGFEFMDVAIGEAPFRFNELPVQKSSGDWTRIAQDTSSLVLFCSGIGEAILPNSNSNTLCAGWETLPCGRDYLAASVPCIKYLLRRQGGRQNHGQLADGLRWDRAGLMFEDCNRGFNSARCSHLQKLVKAADLVEPTNNPESPDDLVEDGAVIFGAVTKSIKLSTEPKMATMLGFRREHRRSLFTHSKDRTAEGTVIAGTGCPELKITPSPALLRGYQGGCNTILATAPEAQVSVGTEKNVFHPTTSCE
ncbi:hypothetical protein FGG08_005578 [Glutinoglossum americanum]|uniref:Uncharacterized protein n=1 Tax=Glutinoglossum americanum TaxID=1670608 RepID=A0A9P8HY45_9PEZI|nr:hypothetical protein FGG08_005578 [Glutinoglossum americanum]